MALNLQICANVCIGHTVHEIACICFRRRKKNTITFKGLMAFIVFIIYDEASVSCGFFFYFEAKQSRIRIFLILLCFTS